jgi:hypothetical protein
MSLKEDLHLDVTELDRATLDQPALFYEQSTLWAEAIFERDKLKEQIAAMKALVDEDIRSRPRDYGWELDKNPTETWVANQAMLHKDVKELMEKYLTAQYNVNIMAVGKEALEHRMNALRIMTELYKGNYFSATSRGSFSIETTIERHDEKQREALDKHPKMLLRRMRKDG